MDHYPKCCFYFVHTVTIVCFGHSLQQKLCFIEQMLMNMVSSAGNLLNSHVLWEFYTDAKMPIHDNKSRPSTNRFHALLKCFILKTYGNEYRMDNKEIPVLIYKTVKGRPEVYIVVFCIMCNGHIIWTTRFTTQCSGQPLTSDMI